MSSDLAPIPRPHLHLPAVGDLDLLDAFLAGRNPRTLAAYDRDLADFARFLGLPSARAAVAHLLAGTPGQANGIALAYRAHLADRQLAAATIGRRLAALRSVVKLAKTLGQVTWTLEVPSPKSTPYRDTAGPGELGWRRLLELAKRRADGGAPLGVRDLALVRLLHDLGLRRGEVESLDLADVDLAGGTVAVVGKGRTEAERLSLPDPVRTALARWIEARGAEPGPLFVRLDRARSGARERLTADAVHKLIGQLGEAAGLGRRLRPHGLRHAAITTALDRSGGDIRAAARFSRHRDLRTLAVYDDNRKDLGGAMARLISEE